MKGNVIIMKAKKILSMLLVGVTALGLLTGCSSNTDDTQNAGTDNAAAEEDQDSTADSSNNADAAQTADQSGTEDSADAASGSGNVLGV